MRLVSEEELEKAGLNPKKFDKAIVSLTDYDFIENFAYYDEEYDDEEKIPETLRDDYIDYVEKYIFKRGLQGLDEEIGEIITTYKYVNKKKIQEARNEESLKKSLEQKMRGGI